MPDNRGEAVNVLPGRDATTRVVIVRRPDGHYAIRPEIWHNRVFHEGRTIVCWVPSEQRPRIFASVDLAEKQANVDYPWARPPRVEKDEPGS